jgi:predicted RNA-binding Zn-ribbon protein involved in translation (DUF1610 family)
VADAAFVPMTCSRSGRFLMTRFERVEGTWYLQGASFARRGAESAADRQALDGAFHLGTRYAGCPGCGANQFVRCRRCSELGCWDTSWESFQCPTCGNSGTVEGDIESLSTSTER